MRSKADVGETASRPVQGGDAQSRAPYVERERDLVTADSCFDPQWPNFNLAVADFDLAKSLSLM
jgi:hypothetical protein